MERNVGQFCLGGMCVCIHNLRGVPEEDAWGVEEEDTKKEK